MNFLNIFKHLLPKSRAWNITPDKNLRNFFDGLTGTNEDVKKFYDDIYEDIFPQTTSQLDLWENQFALGEAGLTDQERRDRLDGTWKELGGQSPSYIQNILRDRGFDVYIHEWWEPGTEPTVGIKQCVTPRNPVTVLDNEYTNVILGVQCGEETAQCGEAFAQCGNQIDPKGTLLVNKILRTRPNYTIACGEADAQCGEEDAQCGNFNAYIDDTIRYIVPKDSNTWSYFLYIGDSIFGDLASIPSSRKNEFEELCLKICPTQQWLGILVEYI